MSRRRGELHPRAPPAIWQGILGRLEEAETTTQGESGRCRWLEAMFDFTVGAERWRGGSEIRSAVSEPETMRTAPSAHWTGSQLDGTGQN